MAGLPRFDNLRGVLQKAIFVPIVYGFISLLPMFLSGWENSDRLADRVFSVIRTKENTFDFVVVGGGTAGALIANRLADHYKVLLLEAGGTPSPFQTVPSLALKLLNHPQTDWSYKTVPQRRACLNSINQQSSWSAGRSLGGTSSINFMTHIRGHPMDYENWASITGNSSWGYSGVLPYFRRTETFSGTSNDPEARGHNGELRIRKPSYIGLSEDWVRAGQELGYAFVDLNGRHEEGFGILQYPIYKGIRQSSYSAFLLPIHKSPRLTIRRYSLVRKVLFRDTNNVAYGVEYVRHGSIETAVATKEIILSAGTLGSSKLLMLSGVGPRGHLEELGIPVISDLPVGRNLQDHLAVHLGPFFIKEPKSFLFDRDVRPENILRWLFLGTGPITTTNYQGAASITSSIAKSRGEGNWPDLHLILHGQAIHQGYSDAFAYAYGLQEDELRQYYSNAVGVDSFHILVMGSRPTSTGQMLLGGASINDPLVINPRYLEDNGDGDFKILLEGIKTAMTIANTSMFRRLGTEFTTTKLPGCEELENDAYWECYIRRYTLSMHNAVGTVALGHVVDSNLRVQGTRGLRVIDASIQPTIVGTGTAASTLMIAEKGAEFILQDYGTPDRETTFFDVIFGREGFIKNNPFVKIFQREFDTLNPLRALLKPFASIKPDADDKERFTRNSWSDNPLLQVISTLFGNNVHAKPVISDSSASGTESVDVSVNFGNGIISNFTIVDKKLNDNLTATSTSDNVISKNQWVLLPPNVNPKAKAQQHSASNIRTFSPVATNLIETGSAPSAKTKGKGGRRFALLQAILKNTTNVTHLIKTHKTISPPPPTILSRPPTSPLGLPKLPHSVNILSSKENEIGVDEISSKKANISAVPPNGVLTGSRDIVAKPIAANPPDFGLLSLGNLLSSNPLADIGTSLFSSQHNPPNTMYTTPNPLIGLLSSLNSFQHLMNSLVASPEEENEIFSTKPSNPSSSPAIGSQYPINTNDNPFNSFLSLFNNTIPNPIDFHVSNSTANKNNGEGIGNSGNPFQFLFGNTASIPESSDQARNGLVNTNTSSNGGNDNILSSWFKPSTSTNSQSQTSSWFNPFASQSNQSSIGSWFRPYNYNETSSWFKPFTFPKLISPFETATTTTTPEPLANSFNLLSSLIGNSGAIALSQESPDRTLAGQTLGAMFPGVNVMDFLGSNKTNTSVSQLSPENKTSKTNNSISAVSNDANTVLQTLLALHDIMNPTTPKPTILEQFFNVFNPPTTKKPTLLDTLFGGVGG